jgi:uncharacterized protein (TIGR02680 family)
MKKMNRWKMNRAGLINFWYYDEEVFNFADGKLLLRGSNGSGKSVTMQSFLPVLLDGKKSPDRLDPFGSKARRMEDYLLGEKDVANRDERTGYLFLEYKRENSSQYITTGIGLQAKRHKDMKFWGFVITDNRRIGEGFQLYQTHQGEKIPLSAKELENRIGEGGEVVRGQKEYMNLVNKHIFGFQTLEAFDELIKLLIQLRSPKLSKDFRPTVIYEILESALPPLGDDDLRHLSDTIENMDQARQQLDQLEREHRSAKKLVDVYDQYNRYILAEKADYYLKTEKSFKSAVKSKEETEKTIEQLTNEIDQLETRQEELKRSKDVAVGEKERLHKHEVWGLQKELTRVNGLLFDLKKDLEKKNKILDSKKVQEIQLRRKLDDLNIEIHKLSKEETNLLEEMELDSREAAFSQHRINEADLKRYEGNAFDFTVWEKEAKAHANLLEEIKNDFLNQDHYKKEMEAKYREASEIKQQIDKLKGEQVDLEKLFESDKKNLEDLIYQWIEKYPSLSIDDLARHTISRKVHELYDQASYEEVKSPIIDATHAYQQRLVQQKGELKHSLELKRKEKARFEDERIRWKTMTDPEPERADATIAYRGEMEKEGRAFVPFYAAVEFQEHVREEQKERIESALKQAGILDSLIIENLIDIHDDRYIRPNPSMFGHTLADYLIPDIDDDHPISKELIDDVLRTILIGGEPSIDSSGTMSIDENGTYQIGDIFGHAPKEEASRFIGRSARKRFQREKIAEYDTKIEEVSKAINELIDQWEELDQHFQEVKGWRDTLPSDKDLRDIYFNLQQYKINIEGKQQAYNRVDAQYKIAAGNYQTVKHLIREKSKHIELPLDYDSYHSAYQFMKSYQEYLNKLEKLKIRLVGYQKEQKSIEERVEELVGEIVETNGERNELEGQIKKEKAEKEAIQNQLNLQGVDKILQRIEQVQNDLKQLESSLDQVKETLPAKQEIIKQEKRQLEKLKRESAFWSDLFASWKYALETDLSRQFVKVDNASAAGIYELFQSLLKQYDRSKMNAKLTNVYYHEQPNLMEYRLTEYDQPLELPAEIDFAELNDTEQLLLDQWKQLNKRKIILMEYQGQKVSPYYVFETLESELANQQQWLDEQDRQLYEDIILKSVGVILRGRINRAEKWIKQMDKLMESRNSSSGLTFSIAWKPKTAETDEEMDTKELVELLQMDSKFLKEEDLNKITRHFQSKIFKAKELIELRNEGNTLHQVLKEVLDYRKWFSFILSYRREGEPKRELTNNAFYKFSGGEKAMAMYIPLFTAAYSRYQEAAPTAPYIVSLDEAFAGVDENNIRDMFQVVEELGFNYIMNSQALWGDYDTVSSLSICELVRPKNADFVTVIRYRWDGQTKHLDVREPILQE